MNKVSMPYHRYRPYPVVSLPDRIWPDTVITHAPVWCSIDLRDGNQALSIPMDVQEKLRMFQMLVNIGFKEIEVGFPSASQIEFDFIRTLIDGNHIPADVTIQILTQARPHLIKRSFESLQGVREAIVHVYNPTSATQRRVVFKKDKKGITQIATDAAQYMMELREQHHDSKFRFEYSPESFTGTELDYALEICQAVLDIWKPTKDNQAIINLPSTVEMSTPNIFADRIEWFLRHLHHRESVILSVHNHNDRGTAVATAELAVMAGAQRVEGALFGNGERTGNMDIMTMAMNLFSLGVDPQLDFSDINHIRDVYTSCTRMDVHARHPYVGELVYTAFSGSHQDAINKAMKAQKESQEDLWDVPYLPIDPMDVGRSYESIIRINSQSGKGGVAYIMEQNWGFHIPKMMQPAFAEIIQKQSEAKGKDLTSEEIHTCFRDAYIHPRGTCQLKSCKIHTNNNGSQETTVQAIITVDQKDIQVSGKGNGPVDAFIHSIRNSLNLCIDVTLYEEHAMGSGAAAEAVTYIGITHNNQLTVYGVGMDSNISTASIKAIINAVNALAVKVSVK